MGRHLDFFDSEKLAFLSRSLKNVAFIFFQFFLSFSLLIFLTFFLMHLMPGSALVEDHRTDPLVVAQLREFYHLDQGLWVQLKIYISHLFRGDFGVSLQSPGSSVQQLIMDRAPTTFFLGTVALALSVVSSFLMSLARILSGAGKRWFDSAFFMGLAVPSFALGPLLIWLFAFYLNWLPVALLETPASYLLPLFLLSFKPTLVLVRTLNASMDQSLRTPYIQTARAMGFSELQILTKWALKNSMLGYLQQVALIAATLISGSFFVETIFAIQGLGSLFVDSLLARDSAMVLAMTLLFGMFVIFLQMLANIVLLLMDPRRERW
ncbi:MAG: hypothetical protein COT73_04095 [Bdellovibrio sp. CG10_big_fil_rev_8_21_14_0_10_47_8]|nr:MAG: hypothetical protein COT73_04095 [Bdellovibrio sp. CG10_big_fil_rev_8_21_14_0_10_47_8]